MSNKTNSDSTEEFETIRRSTKCAELTDLARELHGVDQLCVQTLSRINRIIERHCTLRLEHHCALRLAKLDNDREIEDEISRLRKFKYWSSNDQ